MKLHRIYSFFLSTPRKSLLLLALIGLVFGCKKDDHEKTDPIAGGHSIMVNNGKILVSGFFSDNGEFSTKYWVNGESSNQSTFEGLVANQSLYKQAVDEKFRIVYTFKDSEGALLNYQFEQGIPSKGGKIYYYRNDVKESLEGDSVGNISSVDFRNGKPYFAGYLGEIRSSKTNDILRPITPYVWDGNSSLTKLSLPKQTISFDGISSIYYQDSNEFYVGGLCGIPMYWKNTEAVILDERYGEIWQITKSGSDVYAVGLINKYNSNSTGHTACYWKNGVLHELEDRAQASGIFVDGDDIYVAGSVGNVPASYKPCYWKNGKRVDLPMES